MRKITLIFLISLTLLPACTRRAEPNPVFIPVAPENNQFYDGWELGVRFNIPDGWQGYGAAIDHDGGDGAYYEMGNSQMNLLTFDDSFDPDTLPAAFQHIVVFTDTLANNVGQRDPTAREAHLAEGADPNDSIELVEVNGRQVAQTQRIFNSSPTLHEQVMTTVVDGRIVRLYGVAFEAKMDAIREQMHATIASLQSIRYDNWTQAEIPDFFATIGHPADWQMLTTSKSIYLTHETISEPIALLNNQAAITTPIVIFHHNLNRTMGETPLDEITTAVSNHPTPLTLREQTPTGPLHHRPDIVIQQYEEQSTGLVYFFGAMESYLSPSPQPTMSITAVLPASQADAFAPTFEKIVRSIGGSVMRWLLINPTDLPDENVSPSAIDLPPFEPTASPALAESTAVSPTAVPTTTAIPPRPTAVADPLQQAVDTIINKLNAHERDGYRLNAPFFHGVFGVRIWQINEPTYVPTELATHYAGDTYGVRPLNITADLDTPLPIDWETAVALNPTNLPVDAIAVSQGWGVDQPAEALLYFTEQAGALRWLGAVFSYDSFAPVAQYDIEPLTDEVETFLRAEVETVIREKEVAENNSGAFSALSINPSGTVALFTTFDYALENAAYEIENLQTGERAIYENEAGISITANRAVWLDNRFVVVGFRNDPMDESPIWGHVALLDTITNELTTIEDEHVLGQAPSVTPDGAVIFSNSNGDAVIWQDGDRRIVNMDPILALSNRSWIHLSPVSMSNDQRYFIGVVGIDQLEISRSMGRYVLLDIVTNEATIVASFDAPPMGGYTGTASWNEAGTHAVISPWANFREQQGLTVVEAATAEAVFLGIDSYNGRWLNDEQLIFEAYIDDVLQTHIYNVATGDRYRLDHDLNALYWPNSDEINLANWNTAVSTQFGFSVQVPNKWGTQTGTDIFYLFTNENQEEINGAFQYSIWVEEHLNPDGLPLPDLYANKYSPDRRDDIAESYIDVTVNGLPAIQSDFIFSANGALGYFIEDNGRYIQISLTPYNPNDPFPRQEETVRLFKTMLSTFELIENQ